MMIKTAGSLPDALLHVTLAVVKIVPEIKIISYLYTCFESWYIRPINTLSNTSFIPTKGLT